MYVGAHLPWRAWPHCPWSSVSWGGGHGGILGALCSAAVAGFDYVWERGFHTPDLIKWCFGAGRGGGKLKWSLTKELYSSSVWKTVLLCVPDTQKAVTRHLKLRHILTKLPMAPTERCWLWCNLLKMLIFSAEYSKEIMFKEMEMCCPDNSLWAARQIREAASSYSCRKRHEAILEHLMSRPGSTDQARGSEYGHDY